MEKEGSAVPTQQLVSSSAMDGGGERGAGGKFRKPPPRKAPATPYDRPSNQQRRAASGGGWISKIVHPAYRLISGGANLIIPSLFSSSQQNSSSPPPLLSDSSDHDTDEEHGEREDPATGIINDGNYAVNVNPRKGSDDAGPCELEEKSDVSDSVEDGQGKSQGISGASGLSEIEQLIKEKQFCREEIDRIMKILQSRAVDPDQERKAPSVSAAENVDKISLGGPTFPAEKKSEYLENVRWGTPTPPQQPAIEEDIGASPVDIAKAYMGSRTSEVGFRSKGSILRDERVSSLADQFTSKPLASPTSSKTAVCWPGAILQDQPGYSTPQTQRSRPTLRSFTRTPYSRAIYSNSKPKLSLYRGDVERLSHNPPTPFQSSQTSARGTWRTNVMEDGCGSVGPIRRMRQKYGSEALTRDSPLLWSSQKGPLQIKDSIDTHSTVRNKTFEHGDASNSKLDPVHVKASSSPEGASGVHPQTSKLARQILEQISRPATPKEKSEELKLSAASRKSYSESLSVKSDEQIGSPHIRGFSRVSDERENSLFKIPSLNRTSGLTAGRDVSTSSMTFLRNASAPGNDKMASSANMLNINDIQLKSPFWPTDGNQHKQNDRLGSFHGQSRGQDAANGAQTSSGHEKGAVSSGTRPVLPPIFISKSSQKITSASDNTGFTFPVTKTSSVFSEPPPTPSIMPFSSADLQAIDSGITPSPSVGNDNSSVATLPVSNASIALHGVPSPSITHPLSASAELPTYTFGSKSSNPIVFSCPSMSTFAPNNAPDIQFKFGSGENRVSFSSVGKDAFCC